MILDELVSECSQLLVVTDLSHCALTEADVCDVLYLWDGCFSIWVIILVNRIRNDGEIVVGGRDAFLSGFIHFLVLDYLRVMVVKKSSERLISESFF